MTQKVDRLFVPLSTQPYKWFESGDKTYELRTYARQFTEKFVYEGRAVELRKGYSKGNSLWGTIGKVITGKLDEILEEVDFKLIIPTTANKTQAINKINEIMGEQDKYICFEVEII